MGSVTSGLAERFVLLLGIRRRLRAMAAVDDDPVALARLVRKIRRTDRLDPPHRLRRQWSTERLDVDGFPLHLLTSKQGRQRRAILYLHGGGYMFGPFGTEWAMMSKVAGAARCDFGMLLYPRAPEHQAPQTIAVAAQAYGQLEERYGAANVVLMGTSAGGALAITFMTERRDRARPQPPLAVLLSPGVDMTLRDDVSHLTAADVLLSPEHVRSAGGLFAGELGAADPSVSPLFADLSGLPPLHVFAGTKEILFPSLERFVELANAAGTKADLIVGEDQQHTWPAAPIPEGREARRQIIEIIAGARRT